MRVRIGGIHLAKFRKMVMVVVRLMVVVMVMVRVVVMIMVMVMTNGLMRRMELDMIELKLSLQ